MARYFFHFRNGDTLVPDELGIEFGSAEEALDQASTAACAMWSELLVARREPTLCAFEITDATGRFLFNLPFFEVLERCRLVGQDALHSSELVMNLHRTHRRATEARNEIRSSFAEVRSALDEAQSLLGRIDLLSRARSTGDAEETVNA
ncbi:hypothetical protein [Qipengyuania sp. JC766]|uniref:DUF6894 family protein n=1 Tax=Qipengyuania sp. JC766 TaxID=3232139 RepID=UPI003458CBE2